MANNVFQAKRTNVSGRTPNTTGSYATNSQYIAAGEFALNMADGILYTSNGSAVITVGSNIATQRITNSITLDNDKNIYWKSVNASATVGFRQQSDDNFVFYSTNTAYGSRAVWSIFANSITSNMNFSVPVNFAGNVGFSTVSALYANASPGTAGQYLTSNGTTVYWSTPGAASVNVAAQYAWTNTQSFSANITFTGNNISLVTNTGSIFLAGSSDTNWRIGRNTGGTTKFYYSNNTLDILAAASNLEGFVIGQPGGNAYFETGYAGTFTPNPVYVGNTTSNVSINSTSINAASHTTGSGYGSATGGAVVNATVIGVGNSTVNVFANATTLSTKAILANTGVGNAGDVLTSNGTGIYWTPAAAGTNVAAQYAWTNTQSFSNTITFGNATANAIISGGNINAASFTVGALFTANATLVNAGADFVVSGNAVIGSTIQPDTRFYLYSSWTNDINTYNEYIYSQDNNTAITAIRNRYGIYSSMNNRSQNRDATGVTTFNSNYRAVVGDALNGSSASGGNAFASELVGGNFRSYQYANGTNANGINAALGTRNQVFQFGSGTILSAYGTQSQVQAGNGTVTGSITTAYGVYSDILSNTSSGIGTGYLFYGQHIGSNTATKYGLYLTNEANNYMSNNLTVGGTFTTSGNVGFGAVSQNYARIYSDTRWTVDGGVYGYYNYTQDNNTAMTAIRTKHGQMTEIYNFNQNKASNGTIYDSIYYGIEGYAYNGSSGSSQNGYSGEITGGRFAASQYANGTGANAVNIARGVYGIVTSGSAGAGSINTAFGVMGQIYIPNTTSTGTINTAYGVWSGIDGNSGVTINTGFLYYGSGLAGNVTTKYGLYLTNEANNYLSGNLVVGGSINAAAHTVGSSVVANTTGIFTSVSANAISLTNSTSAWIQWTNSIDGAPAFVTRSAGTKIVLNPTIGVGVADYAIGTEANYQWYSTRDNTGGYKWYGGTTNFMLANNSGLYHTGLVNAASHTTGSGYGSATGGAVVNATYIAVGNTVSNIAMTTNTITLSSNFDFVGDYSNSTIAARSSFITSVLNGATGIYALPNGTSGGASWQAANSADPTNASKILIATNGSTDVQLISGVNGTGTYLPLSFYTNSYQQMQLTTAGLLTLGNLTVTTTNTSINSSFISIANSTANIQITPISYGVASYGTTTGGAVVNATTIAVGNSSVNAFVNATALSVKSIVANGTIGTATQILASNGTGIYWANTSIYTPVRQQYTGDGTTTSFTVTGGYSPNNIDVYLNGVKMYNGTEVTVSSGTSIVFGTAPAVGTLIEAVGSPNTLRTIVVSTTAPASPAVGDIWVDTN